MAQLHTLLALHFWKLFRYEIDVRSRSLDSAWHIWKYVIPSLFNQLLCQEDYWGCTHTHTRSVVIRLCVWGSSSFTSVPVLSFPSIDVDIISWLCIKSRWLDIQHDGIGFFCACVSVRNVVVCVVAHEMETKMLPCFFWFKTKGRVVLFQYTCSLIYWFAKKQFF